MFINKTNIKLLAAALLTALAAPSCMNLDETREGGYGYLTISGLDLDVQVEQLVPTKAEPVTLKSLGVDAAPVEANATFSLVKDGESQPVQPNTELELKAGTYTLNINYDNNGADGFAEALFGNASYTVTIKAGQNNPLSYSLPLTNSLVAVSVSDTLKKDFTLSSISIAYGKDNTATVSENAYFFVPASSKLTVSVIGTTAGVTKVLEHSFTSPEAAKYADVKFGKSAEIPAITLGDVSGGAFEGGLYFSPAELTNISSDHTVVYKYQLEGDSDWKDATVTNVPDTEYKYLNGLTDGKKYFIKACVGNIESEPVGFSPVSIENCITVAAATDYPQHYTENNELAGTKMQASVKVKLPSIVASLATTISVESGNFKKDNAPIGTFKLDDNTLTNDTAKTIDVSNSADWPYFPNGEGYVLDATIKCVLPNRTIESGPVSSTATITSPVPSFNVTVSAYTSYDKYKEGNLTFANTESNKYTVFDRTAKVTISDALLSNAKYSKSSSITFDTNQIGTFDSNNKSFGSDDKCTSWKNYMFSASMTFDGVTKSANKDCHITGLPYIVSPPSNDGDHHWTKIAHAEVDEGVYRIGHKIGAWATGESSAHTCTFNVPSENITALVSINYSRVTTASASGELVVSLYNGSQKGEEIINDSQKKVDNKVITGQAEMTSIYNCFHLLNTSTVDGRYVRIHTFSLTYN